MGDDCSFQERDYSVGGKKDQNESVMHEALSSIYQGKWKYYT